MSNSDSLYDRCLAIFEHTLEKETRVSAAWSINQGLLMLVNKDLIESVSAEVSSAIACAQRVWMTSDLHFDHANIISYSNRPFRGLEDMTDTHIRLLQKVGPEEILVFVGDMALGDYQSGVDLMRLIPGRKILVAGNHDLTRDGQCKLACEKGLFEAVVPFLFWQGSLGQLVPVTHYPILAPAQRGVVINYQVICMKRSFHGLVASNTSMWGGTYPMP